MVAIREVYPSLYTSISKKISTRILTIFIQNIGAYLSDRFFNFTDYSKQLKNYNPVVTNITMCAQQ